MKTHAVGLRSAEFWGWLRLEAGVELALLVGLYHQSGGSWPMLAALFLLPDLAILGYLAGPKPGSHAYNLAHSYAVAGTAILGFWIATGAVPAMMLAWPIHIAFDRTVGYGLKSTRGFLLTHLSEPRGRNAVA